jgi:hypothetical protein
MKEKTIDYILRATWQAVARMYNEEANKYGASMAVGLLCYLSTRKRERHLLLLAHEWEWKLPA